MLAHRATMPQSMPLLAAGLCKATKRGQAIDYHDLILHTLLIIQAAVRITSADRPRHQFLLPHVPCRRKTQQGQAGRVKSQRVSRIEEHSRQLHAVRFFIVQSPSWKRILQNERANQRASEPTNECAPASYGAGIPTSCSYTDYRGPRFPAIAGAVRYLTFSVLYSIAPVTQVSRQAGHDTRSTALHLPVPFRKISEPRGLSSDVGRYQTREEGRGRPSIRAEIQNSSALPAASWLNRTSPRNPKSEPMLSGASTPPFPCDKYSFNGLVGRVRARCELRVWSITGATLSTNRRPPPPELV